MILVIASQVDDAARALVDRWPDRGATILTPLDLSEPGWSVTVPTGRSTAVASHRQVPQAAISGVVTNLPCVFPAELSHIRPDDRHYVAMEMTALLRCWLELLPCPKLNRPTTGSLSGPNWSQERWLCVAAQVGLPLVPSRREVCRGGGHASGSTSDADVSVVVVGQSVVGTGEPKIVDMARRLSEAGRVDLLTVRIRSVDGAPRIAGASPFSDLANPFVQSAVLRYFGH